MPQQPILNIAEIFARKNVKKVIISPGSRSAPLTLAFARHLQIETKIIPDERSAAFVALGMALTSGTAVGLVCTSGSAGLNYYPAVAEAFFQNIPLIIITADRPKEWIGQQDGQTIFQSDLYAKHIKRSFDVASDFTHKDSVWYTERIISEAINVAMEAPCGPVHINVPLREPLYPAQNEEITFEASVKVIEVSEAKKELRKDVLEEISRKILSNKKVLLVGGQANWKEDEIALFSNFARETNCPLIGDVISNLHNSEEIINLPDAFLGLKDKNFVQDLQPELLITFGGSVISKNLKLFLRKYKPKEHWHIQEAGEYADTFQSVTKIFRVNAIGFFSQLIEKFNTSNAPIKSSDYRDLWRQINGDSAAKIQSFFQDQAFSEFEAVKILFEALPTNVALHLSNSMPVRYANYIGLSRKNAINVFANRGTSGIDGCTSTAVGSSFVYDGKVVLLTGDMAFFYDRNAFWHNYSLPNLRVVLLNNHGGGIFGLIDGPGDLPEREEYFETPQKLTARNTAADFNLDYYFCTAKEDLQFVLKNFFSSSDRGRVLEIETDRRSNREVFSAFKQHLNS